MNISSLPYHFEELEELLNEIHIKFSIIGISESKLRANLNPLSNITILNKITILNTPQLNLKKAVPFYISHQN